MNPKPWRAGILTAALLAIPAFAEEPSVKQQPAPDFGAPGLTVRSGMAAYTGPLGGATVAGVFMGIQAEVPLLSVLGLELGYEGSANGFEETNAGTLWRHNVGGLAKLGPTLGGSWKPFLGAGVGVSYIDPSGVPDALEFDEDIVAEVPLAAGLEYRFYGVTAGARATYQLVFNEDFAVGNVDEGDLFSAGVSLGGRF
ncbi:hypothetical protein ACLESO_32330 [Pyxidicoccus sp. 3LG]